MSERALSLGGLMREDIKTIFESDPAARSWFEVLTCYPGLWAIWSHRAANWLWHRRLRWFARYLSHVARRITGVEIHPGASIGRRFFIDHGMGVVIGETTEIGDDVLVYKGAVLGGVSLSHGKRHPTVGDGVVIGSNATVLGPIEVGDHARIGSGAVVLHPVPEHATAVGVPARLVRGPSVEIVDCGPLDHGHYPDPLVENCARMSARLDALQERIAELEGLLTAQASEPSAKQADLAHEATI